jgi:hypothetical protein
MAVLEQPTVEQFFNFKHEPLPDPIDPEELQYITDALESAHDLAWTMGIRSIPDELPIQRIWRRALLDKAWQFMVETEERESFFSSYNSERIGSYSYSKGASKPQGGLTAPGGSWWDYALGLHNKAATGPRIVAVTENVMTQPYQHSEWADYGWADQAALQVELYDAPDNTGSGSTDLSPVLAAIAALAAASGDSVVQFQQSTPANPWTITHTLDHPPDVTVIVGGQEVMAAVTYPTPTTVLVSFSSPQTGQAVLR